MGDVTKIRELNDAFRTNLVGGRLMLTRGILSLPDVDEVVQKVREFNSFDQDNDPYQEHDFGAIEVCGERLFWKFDYYSNDLREGSPDPSDPKVTTRVLTVMLSSEY